MLPAIFSFDTLIAGLHLATPLILAALGGAICLKTGVLNIALEGYMLMGALAGVVAAYYLHNAYLGVAVAAAVGMVFALVFAVFDVTLGANEIIAGIGLNMFALGMTTWLLISVWNTPGAFLQVGTPGLPEIRIPLVASIPFLGRLFSGHNILDYGAWVFALLVYLFMQRTVIGLRMRAVGEHPQAAQTAGLNPAVFKYLAILLSGALAGMAGAHMSLAALKMFSEGMSAGRGFIAFTAVVFGGGSIISTVLVSLFFGLFGSLAIRMEGFGLPTYFIQMVPYVLTIVILLFSAYQVRARKKVVVSA
jgi:ABC-type uncharacterized transport system permease subunit